MNYEWRIDLPKIGISVCFISNGCVRMLRHRGAAKMICYDDHVDAAFDDEGFTLWIVIDNIQEDRFDFDYGVEYDYKTMPTLKTWLIAQKFEAPTFY